MSTELGTATQAMTTWWDETTWLPFVEADNCNITGPGHQDKDVFAQAVTAWERTCDASKLVWPEWSAWKADDIAHLWVVSRDNWETWRVAPSGAPGAVPAICNRGNDEYRTLTAELCRLGQSRPSEADTPHSTSAHRFRFS